MAYEVLLQPGIEWRTNSKGQARQDQTRSFHPNPRRNVHACKRKSAGNVDEHAGKFVGNSMKVVGKFAGNMQQMKNTMKIFMIFIINFPENLNMHRNTN